MKHPVISKATRRATLTLPAAVLRRAEHIARSRHVSLSAAVAKALADGLQIEATRERGDQALHAYRRAFAGFTGQEMMVLNGIIVEPRCR